MLCRNLIDENVQILDLERGLINGNKTSPKKPAMPLSQHVDASNHEEEGRASRVSHTSSRHNNSTPVYLPGNSLLLVLSSCDS